MYVKNSPSPTRNLKQLARCPPALSLGSNTGKTLRQMTGMENTKNSMDRAMNILVTPISLLDKLEEVWLRHRTVLVSLTAVMVVP